MSANSSIPNPPRRARILCADDHVHITNLLTRLLNSQGYDVHVANDGQTALVALLTHPGGYDLVISDHDMPGLNGLELVRQAKAAGCKASFIIHSGAMCAEMGACYADLGVTHNLQKPVPSTEMLRSVKQLLNEPTSH